MAAGIVVYLAWLDATSIWFPDSLPPGRARMEGNVRCKRPVIHPSLATQLVWMEAPSNWFPDSPPPGRARVEGQVSRKPLAIRLVWMEATSGNQKKDNTKLFSISQAVEPQRWLLYVIPCSSEWLRPFASSLVFCSRNYINPTKPRCHTIPIVLPILKLTKTCWWDLRALCQK